MDKRKNRQGHIRLPFNIWQGEKGRTLRDDETVCDECRGCGGHSETEDMLIKCCGTCYGKGYLDWIDRAKGKRTDRLNYYISNPGDKNASVVTDEFEEMFMKKIEMQITGVFKFIPKDEI